MSIPSGDLYQLARIRYEDRQVEAEQRQRNAEATNRSERSSFDRLQSMAVTIGMALVPIGESLRNPVSEQRSLDIST